MDGLESFSSYVPRRVQLSTFWVASTRSVFFFALSLALALWQFLATCLEVRSTDLGFSGAGTDCSRASLQLSFYTGGLGASSGDTIVWPYWALDSITVASLFGFLFVIVVQVGCLLRRTSGAHSQRNPTLNRVFDDRSPGC